MGDGGDDFQNVCSPVPRMNAAPSSKCAAVLQAVTSNETPAIGAQPAFEHMEIESASLLRDVD
jgi:hypothetical protein